MSVRDTLDKGVEEFPRLCYVSEKELLTVVSCRGDPVPVLPVLSRLFPGLCSVRITELAPSKHTTSLAMTATSNEEEGTLTHVCMFIGRAKGATL